jgi:hypothetical protein
MTITFSTKKDPPINGEASDEDQNGDQPPPIWGEDAQQYHLDQPKWGLVLYCTWYDDEDMWEQFTSKFRSRAREVVREDQELLATLSFDVFENRA